MKFESPVDIIRHFFAVRKEYYVKRKASMLDKITKSVTLLESKVRFIMDIIEGSLVVNNRKRSEIETYLDEHSYLKVDDKYDHLIGMPVHNLTEEKKDQITEQLRILKSDHETLVTTEIETMWKNDIKNIM
jgi:DNA topoisomerase-2